MAGGGIGFSISTTSPASGFTFLVIKAIFRNLNPLDQAEISIEDVSVIGNNGQRYKADDLSKPPREFVFKIEEDAINQDFELKFRDASPIPFSVDQDGTYAFTTEISSEPDLLPYDCMADGLPSLDDRGRLTFYRQIDTGITLGYLDPDGSNLTSVCDGNTFGDLQLAADGAALLLATPPQGWSSLYLIEPEGEVYPLVRNGLNIEARFGPSDRWILFAVEKLGETDQELYVFDRKTISTTLIQAGMQVDFNFLNEGQLIITYRENEDSDLQYFIGAADGSSLEPLKLPEDIGYATVSANKRHLVYREADITIPSFTLFIADLDGSNVQELAESFGLSLYYTLSPNSQAILMGVGEGETGDRIELRNLTAAKSWTIATGIDDADFSFSADDQWATVVTTVGDHHTLYIINITDGSIREIKDAVNAFFSPNSTQLAYTVRQPNGDMEMFVTVLDSETVESRGPGVITGWFPRIIGP
jgi:hypothetical protein